MEFRSLITFLKIAELNNFSQAAEKLGYSQSAITVQVQQLEKELGVKLFDRMSKGVALTKEGQQFRFYANEMVRLSIEATSSIKSSSENPDKNTIIGTLRIGSIESISTAILPDLLAKFHEVCPKVNIIVHTKARDVLISEALSNSIDLFFTFENKRTIQKMKRICLGANPIVFVAPVNHSVLCSDSVISLEELITYPFLLTEQKESYRSELDKLLAVRDLEINPIMELSNTETILHLVEENIGLSFVPFFSAERFLKGNKVSVVPVEMEPLKMEVQLFYHNNKWMTSQMKAFIEVAEAFFGEKDVII